MKRPKIACLSLLSLSAIFFSALPSHPTSALDCYFTDVMGNIVNLSFICSSAPQTSNNAENSTPETETNKAEETSLGTSETTENKEETTPETPEPRTDVPTLKITE